MTPKYNIGAIETWGRLVGDPDLSIINSLDYLTIGYGISQDDIYKYASIKNIGTLLILLQNVNYNCFSSNSIKKIDLGARTAQLDFKLFGANNPALSLFNKYWGNPYSWDIDTRPSGWCIISTYGIHDGITDGPIFDSAESMANFIKNMANCQVPAEPAGDLTISINGYMGVEPSSSDTDYVNAINTLKEKGYTVIVNKVVK